VGRHATERANLPDGRVIGYSLKRRGDYFRVVFPDPADPCRYLERSTGATTKADAYPAAAQLILAAYAPTVPRDQRRVSWDEVLSEIEGTATVRPATRDDYRSAVSVLRAAVETDGPNDVTPEVAARFKRVYAAGTFRRGKAADARAYTRSPNTVRAALRKLGALWGKHLRELGYVRSNPWDDVTPPPAVRRKPAVPDDATVAEFFAWLDRRYKGWRLPRLFCEVKALAGCRTLDLCSLRSDQLRAGRLVFDADRAKGRAERSVPLPADLAAALEKVKGETWLWERYAAELQKPREGRRPFDPVPAEVVL
jgi:integrase